MILLVEPNPLRSRLNWLTMAADALPEARIVIPKGVKSDHLIDSLPSEHVDDALTYPLTRDPLIFSEVSTDEIESLLKCLTFETHSGDTIVFMALDEMTRALGSARLRLSNRLPGRRLLGIRYRPSSGVRLFGERALWWWHDISIAILDERRRLNRPYSVWLPDPSIHNVPSHASRDGWSRIVVVGRQDARKGLGPTLRGLSRILAEFPDVSVHVQGILSPDVAASFQRFSDEHRETVTHDHAFLSEGDLARLMTASDVCLLPYAPIFTGSSGVLSDAVAFQLPVLATSHGLVGYRVQKYHLGRTFKFASETSLVNAYTHLRQEPRGRLDFSDYASDFSRSSFERSIRLFVRADR